MHPEASRSNISMPPISWVLFQVAAQIHPNWWEYMCGRHGQWSTPAFCFGRVAGTKNISKNATNLPKKGDSSLNPSHLRVKCLVQRKFKPCKDWHTQRPRARRKLSEKHHLEACGSGLRLMTRGMGKCCQITQWNTRASGGYTRKKITCHLQRNHFKKKIQLLTSIVSFQEGGS